MGNEAVRQHLENGQRIDLTIGSAGGPVLSLFRDTLDSDHHVIVLTHRTEQDDPVGYIVLARPHHTERWQVVDVELAKDLRGQGLTTNLYRGLTAAGYRLQSGDILSSEAERVWRSLGKAGAAKVLDTQTSEVEPFDERPVGDGSLLTGRRPRFYWVTEGQALPTTYYRAGPLSEAQRLGWLDGVPVGRDQPHLLGVNTFVIEGDI
jgi:hypothetical protein